MLPNHKNADICPKIVLIDDVKAFGQMLGPLLRNRAAIIPAHDHEEAEAAIVSHPDAAIFIVDGCLKEAQKVDTLDLVKLIKTTSPLATVIVRTSHNDVEAEFMAAGADYVLLKSGKENLTYLLQTLNAHLDVADAATAKNKSSGHGLTVVLGSDAKNRSGIIANTPS